ncbi:MAG: hypothetical protein JW894_14355 [Bacteroidales bacterium]|nr:hypothetical protein [Bacteroidales bacterium]
MNKNHLVICLFVLLLSGCSRQYDHYNISPKKIEEKGINVKISCETGMKEGELILKLRVKNRSNRTISVEYNNCCLTVDTNRMTFPETVTKYKTVLPPEENEVYEMVYHPVNSLCLYNKINYRGDMKQYYTLNLDFIKDEEDRVIIDDTIRFKMAERSYQDYLSEHGKNAKIKLFDLDLNRDSFINLQEKYMEELLYSDAENSKIGITENSLQISGTDLILDNRIIRISGFQQSDTLYMEIGIINKGKEKLKVNLDSIKVNVQQRVYSPESIRSEYFLYDQSADSAIILKQGARFFFLAKYKLPGRISRFILHTDWLMIQSINIGSYQKEFRRLIKDDLAFNSALFSSSAISDK